MRSVLTRAIIWGFIGIFDCSLPNNIERLRGVVIGYCGMFKKTGVKFTGVDT